MKGAVVMSVDKNNKKFYWHVLLMLGLGLMVSCLPPFGQITELGMKVFGVFVMLIYGWIFVDIFWVSVLGFVLLALTGITTINAELALAFSDSTMLVIIFVTALAAGLDDLGLGDAIASYMLSRKIIIGRPWILIIFLCILGALMSIVGKNILGLLLIWNIVSNIAKLCGYEKKGPLLSFVCCLVAYCCFLPVLYVPFQSNMLLFGGIYKRGLPDIELMTGQFFIWGILMVALTVAILLLLGKFVFRIDASKFNFTEEMCQEFAAKKVSKVTKAAMILLVVYIVILCLPAFLSKELPIIIFINKLGIIGWTIIYMSIFVLWRDEKGQPALNLPRAFSKIQWPMMMLYGITIPLGEALSHNDVGVMATLTSWVTPILDHLGVIGIYAFAYVFLVLVTQILHNMIAAVLLMPLMGPICISVGADPQILYFIMFTALSNSFASPAASMFSGFIFGQEMIDVKRAYLWGWLIIPVMGIVLFALMPLFMAML